MMMISLCYTKIDRAGGHQRFSAKLHQNICELTIIRPLQEREGGKDKTHQEIKKKDEGEEEKTRDAYP